MSCRRPKLIWLKVGLIALLTPWPWATVKRLQDILGSENCKWLWPRPIDSAHNKMMHKKTGGQNLFFFVEMSMIFFQLTLDPVNYTFHVWFHVSCLKMSHGESNVYWHVHIKNANFIWEQFKSGGWYASETGDHGLLYTRAYMMVKENRVGHFGVTCDETIMASVFINMSGTRRDKIISCK